MTILWIKCAERMPPDDDTKIILNDGNNSYVFECYMIHISWMKSVAINHKWIPYDEATWRKLNEG